MSPAAAKSKHPNRVSFEGVLTKLDSPSDRPPSGARGHRVILSRDAAEMALPTLQGMAVSFSTDWQAHNARQKCGVITGGYIEGNELRVRGHIYARDFPEVEVAMRNPKVILGMSYEMCDAHVADMRAEIWTLTRVIFTGAAILRRDKAAYKSTSIALEASTAGTRRNGKLKLEVVTVGKVRLKASR